jgi:prolycopene isomerase
VRRTSLLSAFLITAVALAPLGCGGARPGSASTRDYDVVVVGAGMGGLTAGTYLAAGGLRVLVLEQHEKVGGLASSFQRGEFVFDTALHEMSIGVGEGSPREIIEQCGVGEKVELIRVPQLFRAVYPDLEFELDADAQTALADLCQRWPAECDDIRELYSLMGEVHEEAAELRTLYRAAPFKAKVALLVAPFRQPTIFRFRAATVAELFDELFEDPQLKRVLGSFWPYYGPPPSRLFAPTFMLASHTYMEYGAWQVKGTAQALSDAYAERIVELGGEIRTSTLVTAIDVDGEGVTGVTTAAGERITSRYVVSNADPYQTFFTLVDEQHVPDDFALELGSLEPASSVVGVYLGLDVEPSFFGVDDYEIIYFADTDPDRMNRAMLEGRWSEGWVTITYYSVLDPESYAPPGKSVVALNAYSDYDWWPDDPAEYEEAKRDMMDQLIELAGNALLGLADHIEVEIAMTPRTIAKYTLQHRGVPYGFASTPDQPMRVSNKTPIEGLYLAGSWTFPFHGVSMAQVSGYKAAQLILDLERD